MNEIKYHYPMGKILESHLIWNTVNIVEARENLW